MKRYLTFAGQTYYAHGGANDLIGSYDSIEEAEGAGRESCNSELRFCNDW